MRNFKLPVSTNWRTSFPPVESMLVEDVETSGEDYGDAQPRINGAFMKDGRLAWQSIGPHLRVISTNDGVVRTSVTFGASIHDDSAQVTCVIELPESRLPLENPNPNFPPLLISGVASELTGGYVHIYHAGTGKILRSVHFKEKVTALSLILCNRSEISPLSSLLKNMNGVIAVGTCSGKTYIMDLRRSDILDATLDPLKKPRNEIQCCSVQLINPEEDSAEVIDDQVKLCIRNGNHLGFVLNAKRENQVDFHGSKHDDFVYVSKMLYIPETTTLVIGFNFSGFQLWDVSTLQLLYSSKQLINKMAITGLGFLDPTDDPREVCYLWVLYESSTERRTSKDDLPFGSIFNCTYETKQHVPEYGNYFENFLSISESFELDLPSSFGTNGRLISCQTVSKTTTLPRISFLPESESPNDEGLSLDLFMMVFELWSTSEAKKTTQMILFDLNQWYKAQFPVCGRPDLAYSYLSIHEVKHNSDNGLIAVQIDPSSVKLFDQLINVEQYFFPSALNFDYIQMSSEQCISSNHPGAQQYVLKKLEADGANSLLRPAHLYDLCTSVSLKPFLYEMIPEYELTSTEQRNYVLSLALEYGLIRCITDCIQQWADGRHCVSGCTLPAIIHWAWDRVSSIKQHADRLCVPLFDYSGTKLDTNGSRSLELCRAQMVKALQVFKYIEANHSNELIANSLEHRISALERVCEYYYGVLWFLNTGLLPEQSTMTLTNPQLENQKVVLHNIMGTIYKKCSFKRVELKRLLVKAKEDYDQRLTSVPSLYLIDCFINEDSGGNSLISQWERESNGSSLGYYPPVALQYLLRIFLIHGVEYSTKIGVIFYFLLDVSAAIRKENPSCGSVIDRLMNFSYGFSLEKNLQCVIQAMWHIDNHQFEQGVEILLKHENCKNSKVWLHRAILRILLFQNESKLALKYLQVMKPPLIDAEDILFHLHTLLMNGLVSQAFLFQRKYSSRQNDLLLRLFDGCEKIGQLKTLLSFPLTPAEEYVLFENLKKSKTREANDLRIFYLLSRGRYTEAVNENSLLQGMKGNISTLSCLNKSDASESCTRDTIVKVISKSLPSITRQLSLYCSAQKNIANNVKQVDRPTPLSMMVHTDSSSESLPALPYYKSSNEAIMQGAINKTKEMWSSLLKTPAPSKAQHRKSTIEDTPFLRAPKTNHQQTDPLALFNLCASAGKSQDAKRQATSPVETEPVNKSKRMRTDVKNVTPSFVAEKPWNSTLDMSSDALAFLRTPVVQKKVTPVNSTQADGSTPLSILKGSSNHTPKRSVQKSVSYQFSRKTGEGSDGKTVQVAEIAKSAARQIRFSLPNESNEEIKSSDVNEVASENEDSNLEKPVTPVAMDVSSQSGNVDVSPPVNRSQQTPQVVHVTPRKPLKAYLSHSEESEKADKSLNLKEADESRVSTPSRNVSSGTRSKTPLRTSFAETQNVFSPKSVRNTSAVTLAKEDSSVNAEPEVIDREEATPSTAAPVIPSASEEESEEEDIMEVSTGSNWNHKNASLTEIKQLSPEKVSLGEIRMFNRRSIHVIEEQEEPQSSAEVKFQDVSVQDILQNSVNGEKQPFSDTILSESRGKTYTEEKSVPEISGVFSAADKESSVIIPANRDKTQNEKESALEISSIYSAADKEQSGMVLSKIVEISRTQESLPQIAGAFSAAGKEQSGIASPFNLEKTRTKEGSLPQIAGIFSAARKEQSGIASPFNLEKTRTKEESVPQISSIFSAAEKEQSGTTFPVKLEKTRTQEGSVPQISSIYSAAEKEQSGIVQSESFEKTRSEESVPQISGIYSAAEKEPMDVDKSEENRSFSRSPDFVENQIAPGDISRANELDDEEEEDEEDDDEDIVCLDSSPEHVEEENETASSGSVCDDDDYDLDEASSNLEEDHPETRLSSTWTKSQHLDTTYNKAERDSEEYEDESVELSGGSEEENESPEISDESELGAEENEGDYSEHVPALRRSRSISNDTVEYENESVKSSNDNDEESSCSSATFVKDVGSESVRVTNEVEPISTWNASKTGYDLYTSNSHRTPSKEQQEESEASYSSPSKEQEESEVSYRTPSKEHQKESVSYSTSFKEQQEESEVSCSTPSKEQQEESEVSYSTPSKEHQKESVSYSTSFKEQQEESEVSYGTPSKEQQEESEVSYSTPSKEQGEDSVSENLTHVSEAKLSQEMSASTMLTSSTPRRTNEVKPARTPSRNSVLTGVDEKRLSEPSSQDPISLHLTGNESTLGSSKDPVCVGGYLSSSEGTSVQVTVVENVPTPKRDDKSNADIGVEQMNDTTVLDDSEVSKNEVTVGTSFWSESENDISRTPGNRGWMFEKRIADDSVEQDSEMAETEIDTTPSFIFGNLNDVALSYQQPKSTESPPPSSESAECVDAPNVEKITETEVRPDEENVDSCSAKSVPKTESESSQTPGTDSPSSSRANSEAAFERPKQVEGKRTSKRFKANQSLSDSELFEDATRRNRSLSSDSPVSGKRKSLQKKRQYGSDSKLSVSHVTNPCMPEKSLLQAVMKSALMHTPESSVLSNMSTLQSIRAEVSLDDDSSNSQFFRAKVSAGAGGKDEGQSIRQSASMEEFSRPSPSIAGETSIAKAMRRKRLSAMERRKSKLSSVFTSLDQISELPETNSDVFEAPTVSNRRATKRSLISEPHSPPTRKSVFLKTRSSRSMDALNQEESFQDVVSQPKKRRSILNLTKLKAPRESASFKTRSRCSNYKFKELDVPDSDESFQRNDSIVDQNSEDQNRSISEPESKSAENALHVETNKEEPSNEDKLNDSIASRVSQRRTRRRSTDSYASSLDTETTSVSHRRTRRRSTESYASSQDVEMANLDDSITSQGSFTDRVRTRSSSLESIAESATSDVGSAASERSQKYRVVSIRRRSTPLYTAKELQRNSVRHRYSELDVIPSEEELSDSMDTSATAENTHQTTRKTRTKTLSAATTEKSDKNENSEPVPKSNARRGKSPAVKAASQTPTKKSTKQPKNAKNDPGTELKESHVATPERRTSSRASSQTKELGTPEPDKYAASRRLTRHQNSLLKKTEEASSPVVSSPKTRSRRSVGPKEDNPASEPERSSTPVRQSKRLRNPSFSGSTS